MVIMVIAFVFNNYLVEESIPERSSTFIKTHELSKVGFLMAVNCVLLVVGCFMDIIQRHRYHCAADCADYDGP